MGVRTIIINFILTKLLLASNCVVWYQIQYLNYRVAGVGELVWSGIYWSCFFIFLVCLFHYKCLPTADSTEQRINISRLIAVLSVCGHILLSLSIGIYTQQKIQEIQHGYGVYSTGRENTPIGLDFLCSLIFLLEICSIIAYAVLTYDEKRLENEV